MEAHVPDSGLAKGPRRTTAHTILHGYIQIHETISRVTKPYADAQDPYPDSQNRSQASMQSESIPLYVVSGANHSTFTLICDQIHIEIAQEMDMLVDSTPAFLSRFALICDHRSKSGIASKPWIWNKWDTGMRFNLPADMDLPRKVDLDMVWIWNHINRQVDAGNHQRSTYNFTADEFFNTILLDLAGLPGC